MIPTQNLLEIGLTNYVNQDKDYILGLPITTILIYFLADQKKYPTPTYDFFEKTKYAKNLLWQWKKSAQVKSYNSKILSKHVKVS